MSDQQRRDDIARLCRAVPTLPPYDAIMAYREAVRLEGSFIAPSLPDLVRGKYLTYLKRWTLRPPARYFTDHNYAQKLVPTVDLIRRNSTSTVLDAACGNGFEAVLFALHGRRVHANDVSSARATVANARGQFYRGLLGDPFDLRVTCGNAIDLRDVTADVVFVQEASIRRRISSRRLRTESSRETDASSSATAMAGIR
jgi:SAM-dependent methyltransferase